MKFMLNIVRVCAVVALATWALHAPMAAAATAKPQKNYGRLNFGFHAPTQLSAQVHGTTAVLKFGAPVTQSAESIRAALPGYVTKATLSPDKRTVTLTLSKPYRLRQFVSGNQVGVDLVGAPEKPTKPTMPEDKSSSTTSAGSKKPFTPPEDLSGDAAAAPTHEPTAESAPEEETHASAPQEAVSTGHSEPPPAKASSPKIIPKAAPKEIKKVEKAANKKPATKEKPTAKAVSAPTVPPAPTAAEKTAPADPMLSTKPAPHTPEAPVLSTKHTTEAPVSAPQAPAEETAILTTKHTPAPHAEKPPTPDTPPKEAPAPEEHAAAETPSHAPPTPSTPGAPFVVSAHHDEHETTLTFPWSERTGAAVFKRARDIWVVFSRQQDVNLPLLRSLMPKQVINVTQYAYKGNTVLRLVTDGSLQPRAALAKSGYGWEVTLGTSAPAPVIDTPLSTDTLESTTRLILAVFDVSTPLRFFDPSVGDQLIIVPAFENGRGIGTERNFPEFSLFASTQGIAIASKRPDLATHQTRSGLILSTNDGLALSDTLPRAAGTPPTSESNGGVMIPYGQWFVPVEKFRDTLAERQMAVGTASEASKADAWMGLVKLHMAHDDCASAGGLLNLIAEKFPDYYRTKKLALLSAACNVMKQRIPEAAADLAAPELAESEEAILWREVVALYAAPLSTAQAIQKSVEHASPTAATPASSSSQAAANDSGKPEDAEDGSAAPSTPAVANKPVFHYLKFNKKFIRYYPPRMRQQLTVIAADAYMEDGQIEKATAAYDALMRDSIGQPVKLNAEYALALAYDKKGDHATAIATLDTLGAQVENPYIAARARYMATMLRYEQKKITGEEAADAIENNRMRWRGDALERQMLMSLVGIYSDLKHYDEVLRTKKALLDAFPNDPQTLKISGEMAELFENIFLGDMADEMEPLKALSLFYEFRDLTPLGEKGDHIIQRLADRLAALDLLERATQLLEHQIKFRTTASARSQVGARLALLHLLNQRPQEALSVLEVTNYGGNSPELQIQRQQLTAEALMKLNKNDEALGVINNDTTKAGALLRMEILWAMQDWPSIANHAEDILGARPNLTDPLTPQETEVLLKLALAYTFEGDYTQLRYLRDYYASLIPDTAYKQIFDYITNDTTPLDPEDFAVVAQQISHTEGFLGTFKEKIAAGKLSEAVK